MSWSKLHGGSQRHPKVVALEAALGISELEARGLALGMWAWVIETEPSGDLSAHPPLSIARGLAWRGDPQALIDALVACKLLDRSGDTLTVHDWTEHAEGWIEAIRLRKYRDSQKKQKRTRTVRVQHSTVRVRDRTVERETETEKEIEIKEEDCAAPPSQAPSVISVPCSGGKTFAVTQPQIDRWKELFPAVDVLVVVRKAVAWAEANPRKRKTAARMASWLATVWLAKAQDEGGDRPRYGAPPTQQSSHPPSASIDELPPLPNSYFANQRKAAEPQTALAIVSNGNEHVKK